MIHVTTNIFRPLLPVIASAAMMCVGCDPEPPLHLHGESDSIDMLIPIVDLDLDVYWDYTLVYGVQYEWQAEWSYGWDDFDRELFGELEYEEPSVFNLRRYYTAHTPNVPHTEVMQHIVYGKTFAASYKWGYWDFLVWNDIQTLDGVQSLLFDEESSLDSVIAYTHQTMNASKYNLASGYKRSFYTPEPLFSAYTTAVDINSNLDGFTYDRERNKWVRTLDMQLQPITYIYLTQVILHHNNGRVTQVDGNGNLSGMARSVNVNTGVSGSDAITVNYNVRMKKNCTSNGENVDIVGGRFLTFGMCNLNANNVVRSSTGETSIDDGQKHYMDVTMQFNNGMDSTFVFDVTDQVRKRYKGGVITVELDMDNVPIPQRSGGSGFNATVEDYDSLTYEFPMEAKRR